MSNYRRSRSYSRSRSKRHLRIILRKVGIAVLFLMTVVLPPLFVHFSFHDVKVVASPVAPKTFKAAEAEHVSDVSNTETETQQSDLADLTKINDASSEINGKWRGVCKKNSIHSVEDFRRTVQNDPVLSKHFAGFNWEKAKLGKQDDERFVFVSHRKGDVIKKTSKPIRLPKGDGYITDGTQIARTFCCNDFTISPSAGVPKDETFSQTYMNRILPNSVIPPPSPPSYPPPPQPPAPVPEPGTMLLIGTGLIILSAACRRKKPWNKNEAVRGKKKMTHITPCSAIGTHPCLLFRCACQS